MNPTTRHKIFYGAAVMKKLGIKRDSDLLAGLKVDSCEVIDFEDICHESVGIFTFGELASE
jgi:hypothetical protein